MFLFGFSGTFSFDHDDDTDTNTHTHTHTPRIGAEKVREIGSRIGYENLSEDDIRIIHYVGKIVAIRAAVLTSTREFLFFYFLPLLTFLFFLLVLLEKEKEENLCSPPLSSNFVIP